MTVEQPVLSGNLLVKMKIDSKYEHVRNLYLQTINMIALSEVQRDFKQELRDRTQTWVFQELYKNKISQANGIEDLQAVLEMIVPVIDKRLQIRSTHNTVMILWEHTWMHIDIVISEQSEERIYEADEIVELVTRSVIRLEYAETFIYYTKQ